MGNRIRLCVLCISAAASLLAQTDRGVITGTVKDASGAMVPGAQVTATQTATNARYTSKTTTAGDFTVPSLPVGTYRIRVENTGFKIYIADNVVVAPGSTVELDVALEVGTSQQTIEINANAQVLQTESARVATEMSNRMVDELPVAVNGAVRSPFDLSAATAEVSSTGQFRVGGGKGGAYGMTLDGSTVTTAGQLDSNGVTWTQINTPSVDALTEFTVTSGGFKADLGHASGGTMSFVSKSGSNGFHGDAYEFLRNQDLDAKGFFGATKPIYKQNDFGVTAGGPVLIPKVYSGKNKTFWFFSYEGFRNRAGASVTPYSVPPPEFYTGDLHNYVNGSGVMYQIYDPATTTLVNGSYVRTPFPNNQIPQSRIDPISQEIINYVKPLLAPNVAATPGTSSYVRNNYVSAGSSISPNNKYSVKGDQVLTQKQRLSFFFERTREHDLYGPTGAPGLPDPLAGNPGYNRSDVYRLSYDYTLTPTLLNRFYAGGNNWEQNHGAFDTYSGAPQAQGLPTISSGWKSKICIPNYPDCNDDFPQIAFTNSEFTAWGVAAPNGSDNIVVELHDDMTKVKGSHTMKWGYFYNNTHYNGFGLQNISGNVTFQDLNTGVPLVTSQATGGGSAFASFLLGQVSGYSLDTPRYLATEFRTHEAYFQDDWRVSQRFTLNLGMRFSLARPLLIGNYDASDFDPTLPNPGAGGLPGALIFDGFGTGRINKDSLTAGWNGWGPRLGFAYSLNNKTTIRGGASRSFGPLTYEGSSSHNLGIVQRITVNDQSQGLNPLWVLQNGAPAWAQVPDIDPSVGNGSNVPYYNGKASSTPSDELNYSFNIERALTNNTMVEVGYVATMAAKIQSNLLYYNQLNLATLPANLNPFTSSGKTLLNSLVGSAAANAAGITPPWSGFNALWGTGATVGQSLRPYPQYSAVDTLNGQGDKIGHSTYNAMQVKVAKRYSSGLTVQASYVLSKLLTDSDGNSGTENQADLRLEKSIASFDQTHVVKINYVYELPFGHGRHFLSHKSVASAIFGDWRFAGSQGYSSGTPMGLGTTVSFPIFNGGNRPTVSTYNGWGSTYSGKFDPAVDSFFQPVSFFGTQPTTSLGTLTRYNPKLRYFPGFNENASLNRTIRFSEAKHLDIRFESFNYLNRTQFGPLSGGTSLQNANFGLWRSQSNSARRMQVSAKFYW
ncbi:MAG: carboxypeptidase regulatory-like domain-containing protein [Bryobacteraceae bacterium]